MWDALATGQRLSTSYGRPHEGPHCGLGERGDVPARRRPTRPTLRRAAGGGPDGGGLGQLSGEPVGPPEPPPRCSAASTAELRWAPNPEQGIGGYHGYKLG